MGKKIGIYGSSFDPITNVHLWTANTVAHRAKLDKIIFNPCSNKRGDKVMQTSDEHRWNMLELAIEGNNKFEINNFEMNQESWKVYSYLTMRHFRKLYPEDELYFIMGADLLVNIADGEWKHTEELISENKFIVMARNGIDMLKTISGSAILRNFDDGSKFHLMDKGISMEISSTYIRDEFSMGGDPKHLLPDKCYDYAIQNKLYKK
jgi:nicotinate-nucleotide adenylyltransferase